MKKSARRGRNTVGACCLFRDNDVEIFVRLRSLCLLDTHPNKKPVLRFKGDGGPHQSGIGVGRGGGNSHLLGPGLAEGIAVVPENPLQRLGVGLRLGAIWKKQCLGIVAQGQDPQAVVHPGAEDHAALKVPVALALETGPGHTGAPFCLLRLDELREVQQSAAECVKKHDCTVRMRNAAFYRDFSDRP